MRIQYILGAYFLLAIGASYSAQAQSDCKVYPSKITDYYVGECKKGLAHGMGKAEGIDVYEGRFRKGYPDGIGTYTWKNGNSYVGEFDKGLKDGEGEFSFKMYGKDTTTVGFWRDDEYIGKENKPPYKVLQKMSVDRLSFKNSESERDLIEIEFYKSGVRNGSVNNLTIQNSSGAYETVGNILRISNIELPYKGEVRYSTPSALGGSSVQCYFIFEINQKGKWEIRVYN